MKLDFDVEGERVSLRLERERDQMFALVGETRFEILRWTPGHLLLGDGRSLEYALSRDPRGGFRVSMLGQELAVQIASRSAGEHPGGSGTVLAPMNGQVVKVMKSLGAEVAAGEVVVVLEAMKMENEVGAPVEGRLASLSVQAGQTVAPGDPLFVVEPL